jgi:UPF0755 protein
MAGKRLWQVVGGLSIGLAGATALAGWLFWQRGFTPVGLSSDGDSKIRVEIETGSTVRQIGRELEDAGAIRSATAWELWMRWANLEPKVGIYDLDPRWNVPRIADQLHSGRVVEIPFTIPEGWRIQQMAEYFERLGWFSAADFVAATRKNYRAEFPWLPPHLPTLEGWLFPDTYQLPLDRQTPEAVVQIMLQRFAQAALPLYPTTPTASSSQTLSMKEWVTLASIVEKEAVVAEERPEIAGVFRNRLRLGMTLGADPTVEYGLNIRQTADRPLTYAEVQTPSPYNTYLNPGLPPTPIASPGLSSLEAALAPADTPYLYFVARYDGSHVFSETLGEHLAAQTQIRKSPDPSSR